MTDNEKPMDSIARLGRTVKQIGARYGLDMKMFLTEPDLDGGAHKAKIVFAVDEDRVTNTPVAVVVDPELERKWQEADEAEQARKAQESRSHLEGLEERLRDPKRGLFDED